MYVYDEIHVEKERRYICRKCEMEVERSVWRDVRSASGGRSGNTGSNESGGRSGAGGWDQRRSGCGAAMALRYVWIRAQRQECKRVSSRRSGDGDRGKLSARRQNKGELQCILVTKLPCTLVTRRVGAHLCNMAKVLTSKRKISASKKILSRRVIVEPAHSARAMCGSEFLSVTWLIHTSEITLTVFQNERQKNYKRGE